MSSTSTPWIIFKYSPVLNTGWFLLFFLDTLPGGVADSRNFQLLHLVSALLTPAPLFLFPIRIELSVVNKLVHSARLL